MSDKFVEILFNGQNLMTLQYILYACKCRIPFIVKALGKDSIVFDNSCQFFEISDRERVMFLFSKWLISGEPLIWEIEFYVQWDGIP